jgi:hypothetical protein
MIKGKARIYALITISNCIPVKNDFRMTFEGIPIEASFENMYRRNRIDEKNNIPLRKI